MVNCHLGDIAGCSRRHALQSLGPVRLERAVAVVVGLLAEHLAKPRKRGPGNRIMPLILKRSTHYLSTAAARRRSCNPSTPCPCSRLGSRSVHSSAWPSHPLPKHKRPKGNKAALSDTEVGGGEEGGRQKRLCHF